MVWRGRRQDGWSLFVRHHVASSTDADGIRTVPMNGEHYEHGRIIRAGSLGDMQDAKD